MTRDDSRQRAMRYRIGDEDPPASETEQSEYEAGRERRLEAQPLWIDQQIRSAMARGDFDNLPYAGKPLPDRLLRNDPDWWVKQLIERERVSGVLPPALQLRKDDAALDSLLDAISSERRVREEIESFNARVIEARRQLLGGPPVVTPLRDVEAEVTAWRERAEHRRVAAQHHDDTPTSRSPRRRWLRRRSA
ncbi:DUF1992 domain-containing protein [Aeromicrobium sp. YIM 150415]|uniref:DnaJ family domain-containing protein n=1 Tax=Aeromicrobium sp. YIM 150415 TaxID=2803912 RepID=UPI001966C870|nr:DUF1992 domain-containing protein [Aeromicrobium sp. YIM 150415]MBM9462545.1 DUF1992 domain-containing protein [Aeromicrobium sp. YIM 150415]